MRSNLDRLTSPESGPDVPASPGLSAPDSSASGPPIQGPQALGESPSDVGAPAWLGSAQWLHGNPASPYGYEEIASGDDGREPRWADDPDEFDPDEFDPDGRGTEGPMRRRWRSTPAAAIGLMAVGVVATMVALYAVFSGGGANEDVAVAFPESAGSAPPSAAVSVAETSSAPTELVVSVVGLVQRPGLVKLAPQSRVADAIEKAGGTRNGADLLSLNLAQPLRDGDQVLVGFADPAGGPQMRSTVVAVDGAGESPQPSGGTTASGSAPPSAGSDQVNLNTASESELDTLPGVGPVTAAAIIAWRQANGSFTSVDQLAEVDGIGPTRLEKLKDRVTV